MKIIGVNVPENFLDKGLNAINIDRLGDIVLIAGKNGSGKSRFLNIIHFCVNNYIKTSLKIQELERNINTYSSLIQSQPQNTSIEVWKQNIESFKSQKKLDSYFKLENRQEKHIALNFVPNKFEFKNPLDISENQKNTSHNTVQKHESIQEIDRHVLAYIQHESDRNFFATHHDYENNNESNDYRASFNKLNTLISAFLGVELGRKVNSCTIFNRELGKADLSDGQKVLLQLCVLIHAQGATLDNLVLILDEPENHLHPAAQIEFIKKIMEVLKNGQIWIATHSVHILSYLDTSNIWYMYDGKIKYAGKEPEEVLYGLLGGEENVEKLHEFLGSPAIFAANQFSYECLFSPNTATTDPEDKQIKQMSEIINKFRQITGKITLLDYGAGKGRFISSIMENQSDLASWLDYIAYDSSPKDKLTCEAAITRVYEDCNNRYFNDRDEILGNKDEKTFNITVMCNVLHEISPDEWISTFQQSSLIGRLISDDGYLLIVEDTAIPYGEKPNNDGFFILGRTELKKLFNITAEEKEFITTSYKDEERLVAHLIPKKYLVNISDDTIKETLEILKDKCCDKIRKLREKSDFRSGRLLGLWSQQLSNIILYFVKRGVSPQWNTT